MESTDISQLNINEESDTIPVITESLIDFNNNTPQQEKDEKEKQKTDKVLNDTAVADATNNANNNWANITRESTTSYQSMYSPPAIEANDLASSAPTSPFGYRVNNHSHSGYRHNFHATAYSLYNTNNENNKHSYSSAYASATNTDTLSNSSSTTTASSYLYIDTAKSSGSNDSQYLSSSDGYMYADSNHSSSSYLAYTTNNTVPIDIDVPLDHNTPKVNIWKEEERCQREDGKDYTWNEKFQYIMDLPDNEDKFKYLSTVANDFVYCANTFGKIIISERNLPDDQKTIKPLSLGGVAGGYKYKCQDIIFKFVVDVEIAPGLWMYGDTSRSDEKAQKSAGHELKGLNHFMEHSNGTIRFPLMAIIDYRGYRLLAISNLPINKKTIVYGSNDGGKTIHNKDPIVEKEMERLASLMNTKGHMVGLTSPRLIYGPGDIEVHKGTDGRYYMLDFARAFPPEYPAEIHGKVGREIFYSMLRPELILKSDVPLSPDAFSGWQTGKDEEESNQEVIDMTIKYHKTIIPECASYIQNALEEDHVCEASDDFFDSMLLKDLKRFVNCNSFNAFQQKSFELIRMVNMLHGRGINVRYLGTICQMIKDRTFKSILFTEMVARVWKRLIFAKLREKMDLTNRPSDEPKQIVAEVFDLLLNIQRFAELKSFWSLLSPGNFKFALLRSFPNCLSKNEKCNEYDLRNSFDVKLLVFRIIQMLNIKINPEALNQFISNPRYIISIHDISEVESKVKYPTVIDYAAGSQLIFEAKKTLLQPKVPPAELIRWVEMGQEKLMMAQHSMPMSSKIILRKAASYILKSNLSNQVLSSYLLIRRGINMLKHCWSHTQRDPSILALWAMMHHKVATYFLFFSIDVPHFKQQLAIVREKLEAAMEQVDLTMVATPYLRLSLPNGVHSEDNYGESQKKCKVYDLISFVYLSTQCPADSKLKAFLRHTLEMIPEISHLFIPDQIRHLLNDDFMYEYFDHLPNIHRLVLSNQIFTPKVALSASRFKLLESIHLVDVDVTHIESEDPNDECNSVNSFDKLIFKWFTDCHQLTSLNLNATWISDHTFENVIPLMSNLTEFSLDNSSVSNITLQKMATSLTKLQKLSLARCPEVNDQGMIPLFESIKTLKEVSISLRHITDATGKSLIPIVGNITKLDLSYCLQLSPSCIADIVRSAIRIQQLNLTQTRTDNSVIDSLEAHGSHFLTHLSLENTNLSGEAPIQTLSLLEPPLRTLKLSTYNGEYSVLWNLFRKLPELEHLRLPTNLNLPALMSTYKTMIDQNDLIMEIPLKRLNVIDFSNLVVSLPSMTAFLDLTSMIESLLMDNLIFVDEHSGQQIPLDDNILLTIGNYILNLKEIGLSSFPIEKRGITCMLSRCTLIRRIIMNNCKAITPDILFELQVEYPHISFICDYTKYPLQSPTL